MQSVVTTMVVCSTIVTVTFCILLSLPQSKLRVVCLQILNYLLAASMALLVISPIDVIPDVFFPIGFADDLGAIFTAIAAVKSARRQGEQLKHLK